MQIQRNPNNNASFGIKLVLREGMFPRKTWDKPDVDALKKFVSTVEARTADKEGTMYITGVWKGWEDSGRTEHMNIYFNNDSYNDAVTLYNVHESNLRNNPNKFIDTLVNLTEVFKIRESAVKATQKARDQIAKLEDEISNTMYKFSNKVAKPLKKIQEKKSFASEVLSVNDTLPPDWNNFQTLRKSFAEDLKVQNEILAKA